MNSTTFFSIFTSATAEQRQQNFIDYWQFNQQHGGELLEADKDLAKKREKLRYFQQHPVRLRKPLANPDAFYRNYVKMVDKPEDLDRMTLMLTSIYKFARHEWVGIKGAWDAVPELAKATTVEDKISRVHLAEEFCHWRLFDEMLKTCGLDQVEWVPLPPWQEWFYKQFPKLPGVIMDGPAFVTELMGVTYYFHLNALFDDVLADEPEVCERLKALLAEITIDEIAHVGQRRNFLGAINTKVSKWLVKPFYRLFFADIPEVALLFDVEQMIKDGEAFDYSEVPKAMLAKSWLPSYCKA